MILYFFYCVIFFFFNHSVTTYIYTLSLHDALPIYLYRRHFAGSWNDGHRGHGRLHDKSPQITGNPMSNCLPGTWRRHRSEEHTSELQSRQYLVCRLLLEKKKKKKKIN